jgi:hypothetical protein
MTNVNRRQFLRGAGTTLALPYLASLQATTGFCKEESSASLQKMIFLSIGYGVTHETWYPDPEDTGTGYTLPEALQPLAKHKEDFTVVQNAYHRFSNQGHWGSTFFLTGANPNAIPGKTFHNTISVDQVAAQAWGEGNRFTSMRFESSPGNQNGHGPGLSLSWNKYGKPLPGLSDPFTVYNKLFGGSEMPIEQRRELIRKKGSSLDVILMDAKRVQGKLGTEDKDKLDEYFQGVREIELRLAKEEAWVGTPKPEAPLNEPGQPGVEGYEEIKLMYDLAAAALQTNSTRVIAYRLPAESLLRSLDVTIRPHDVSHYKGFEDRHAISQLRDATHSELLSHLFDTPKKTKDVNGESLFENTSVAWGSNISTGHYLDRCPVIVAGNTNHLKHGSHLCLPKDTPLCNLWLTLLRAGGINADSFGDSNGVIGDIMV